MAKVQGGATFSLSCPYTFTSGFLANNATVQQVVEALRGTFGNGTAADQVDGIHAKSYTLVASTPQTIDLTSLVDPFGNSITAARCRLFAAKWYSTTDNVPLLLGGAASNAWTGLISSTTATISVYPSTVNNDGWLIFCAPNTTGMVIGGSNKSLKMDPQTAAGQLDLVALFASL